MELLTNTSPRIIRLKTYYNFFRMIWNDRKTAELRVEDDIAYLTGDILYLCETEEENLFTGSVIIAQVVGVFRDVRFLQPGYAMLSIKVLARYENSVMI